MPYVALHFRLRNSQEYFMLAWMVMCIHIHHTYQKKEATEKWSEGKDRENSKKQNIKACILYLEDYESGIPSQKTTSIFIATARLSFSISSTFSYDYEFNIRNKHNHNCITISKQFTLNLFICFALLYKLSIEFRS